MKRGCSLRGLKERERESCGIRIHNRADLIQALKFELFFYISIGRHSKCLVSNYIGQINTVIFLNNENIQV